MIDRRDRPRGWECLPKLCAERIDVALIAAKDAVDPLACAHDLHVAGGVSAGRAFLHVEAKRDVVLLPGEGDRDRKPSHEVGAIRLRRTLGQPLGGHDSGLPIDVAHLVAGRGKRAGGGICGGSGVTRGDEGVRRLGLGQPVSAVASASGSQIVFVIGGRAPEGYADPRRASWDSRAGACTAPRQVLARSIRIAGCAQSTFNCVLPALGHHFAAHWACIVPRPLREVASAPLLLRLARRPALRSATRGLP